MDKKFISFLFFVSLTICLPNCGKKKNVKLGQTYYKLSLLELSEKEQSEQACKQALAYIDKAIEQESRPEYLALKATLLFKIHQEKEGYDCFQKALDEKLEPRTRTEILNNKACLLAEIGMKKKQSDKTKEAMNIWSELEEDKNYLTPEVALFNQSQVYIAQKSYKQAKDKLLKAVTFAPSYLDAHYYLSLTAYELKDYKLAKNELRTVLFLEPAHQGAKQLSNILEK